MWPAVLRLRRRGDSWPPGRTVAWLLGCLALLFVTSSGVGRYMPAMFSMHMVAHMGLSMLVPILLVLGGPVSLALRALPAAGRDDPPGMREWLLAALHSRLSRLLTNPVVATVLFVAGFYGLYFGGLFDAAVGSHAGHMAMNVHFLFSGYLFYWVVIGVDPTPRPIPPLAKVAVVFASLPLHAFFGVELMGTRTVLGGELLPVTGSELAHRFAGRSAVGRRNRLGGRGNAPGARHDRVAGAVGAQRSAHRAAIGPRGGTRRRRRAGRLQRDAGRTGAPRHVAALTLARLAGRRIHSRAFIHGAAAHRRVAACPGLSVASC